MGTALTYARRYSLFALVGIAGEDDLDAPDLSVQPPRSGVKAAPSRRDKSEHIKASRNPVESNNLLEILMNELTAQVSEEDLAKWARKVLPLKNTLCDADARLLEKAFGERLDHASVNLTDEKPVPPGENLPSNQDIQNADSFSSALALPKEQRRRSKSHLLFVSQQPCLICKQTPSDAHHLKFAQLRALGRKVSDEFTVPLCRKHHQDLHRHGNERAWWANMQIEPLPLAKELWESRTIDLLSPGENKSISVSGLRKSL
jgi:hypothetical protein